MSDSLRDQLIAAGFDAPKKAEKKPGKKAHNNNKPKRKGANAKKTPAKNNQSINPDAAALERKKLKAQIKELIDKHKLENWNGEITYRYTVEKKIRELYVNEVTHKQLTDREVAITRLNGDTYLVPQTTAGEIVKINPQWSMFNTESDKDQSATVDEAYSDFKVPDDLKW